MIVEIGDSFDVKVIGYIHGVIQFAFKVFQFRRILRGFIFESEAIVSDSVGKVLVVLLPLLDPDEILVPSGERELVRKLFGNASELGVEVGVAAAIDEIVHKMYRFCC